MNQYIVYERREGNLVRVGEISAPSAEAALDQWIAQLGQNYGRVVVLPILTLSSYHALEAGITR